MEHVFYGNENADVTAITAEYPGIRTPGDLYDVLSGVWCEYTCAPRMRREYSTKHMTYGQCSITAFLVQDIFGGRVYGIPRKGGTFHLYNDVDGHVFDITSEQFDEELCYENNPEQFRETHFSKVEKHERYQYLRKALKRACGIRPDYRHIFFDLDGTLTQSGYGIVDSVIYALKKSGIEAGEKDREDLKKFIGPALFESFQKYYGLSDADADRAVAYYREYYESEGIYRAPLYDGVEKMLQDLREKGKTLYVVTTKPQEMAKIVLRHKGIDGYFQAVIGPGRSERHTDKAVLIRRALQSAAQADAVKDPETAAGDESVQGGNSAAEHSLMVGDRYYDIAGAVQTGVDSLGVLYGYGSRQELCWSGATYIVDSPGQAAELIGSE